jgi:ADP-ribose pyrophosphatase YjhB (NUDIX family)
MVQNLKVASDKEELIQDDKGIPKMAKLLYGQRIGKLGSLRVGCSATIFDSSKQKILLTKRTDNGQWCLPGGGIDPGESAIEACIREVWEETGLHIQVKKLVGVYSNPHQLIEYADGNRFHIIALNFEAELVGGELRISEETTEAKYYSLAEIETVDLMEHHRERISDVFEQQALAFMR